MLKPPASAMPGVTDTLDFVKNLWGSMQIPGTGLPGMSGMATPPLSTDDLDKRIADLKAVESWLNLNLTMLRGTIQALEVQRGTLATLKSMGASMAEAMRQSGVSTDKMATMPFAPFFGLQGQGQGGSAPAKPAAPPAKPGTPAPPPPPPPPAAAGGGSAQPGTAAPAGTSAGADAQGNPAAMGMPAAVAWWNMLQEQFTQAVAQAMTPPAQATPPAPAAAPAAPAPGSAKPAPAPAAAPDVPRAGPAGRAGSGGDGGNEVGNGKPRPSRTKTDKS